MKYDQTNSNNGITYDNDFFDITQNLKKIKCSKKQMEELFPYYWKNKSRISISCLNEDDADYLMSLIDINNIKKQINYLKSFSSSKQKILYIIHDPNFNRLSGGFEGPVVTLKLNQKFKFKFKYIDENQKETYIYSEPFTLPEEHKSNNKYDFNYNNNIEFELVLKQNSFEKNLKIINCTKK